VPLLEFVLKGLWEQRRGGLLRNETYDAIGGLQGAVATKADELFKHLSLAEQKTLQRVFLRIVRPTEGALDTRRRAAFSELPPEGVELKIVNSFCGVSAWVRCSPSGSEPRRATKPCCEDHS
jgi:hypothetical protein